MEKSLRLAQAGGRPQGRKSVGAGAVGVRAGAKQRMHGRQVAGPDGGGQGLIGFPFGGSQLGQLVFGFDDESL